MTAPSPHCQPSIVEQLRELHAEMRVSIGGIANVAADRIEYLEATEANQIATLTARNRELEAALRASHGELIKLAAECHRAKWEFDLSEDFKPSARSARALILKAFAELHRIGDLAIKAKDAALLPGTPAVSR